MKIEIEKNVTKPVADPNWLIAQMDTMEIGDSFLEKETKRRVVMSVISMNFHADGKGVKRFSTSKKGQPKGYFRVWREKDALPVAEDAA
jgi:hypothetical protein